MIRALCILSGARILGTYRNGIPIGESRLQTVGVQFSA
jgi:hypothetical protein